MNEAMTLDELRRGLDALDLENTLSAHDVDADQIRSALDLGTIDEAKAAIREVLGALQAISFGGFPVGDEIDLADLVGFA